MRIVFLVSLGFYILLPFTISFHLLVFAFLFVFLFRVLVSFQVCARKGAKVVLLNRDSARADEAHEYIKDRSMFGPKVDTHALLSLFFSICPLLFRCSYCSWPGGCRRQQCSGACENWL